MNPEKRPAIKAFFDTSALIKRYFEEEGSQKVADLFNDATEVLIAPSTKIETYHVLYRLKHAYPKRAKDFYDVMREIDQDFHSFTIIPWGMDLENHVVSVLEKAPVKSLDAIQMASALIAAPDMFIVSDKQLASTAKKFKLTTVFVS